MINKKQQARLPISAQIKAEKKVTVRENGTLRVQKDFSKTTSRTKQEFAKAASIHNIMKMPLKDSPEMTYADISNPPNLRQLFATIHDVKTNFEKLPSAVRKAMQNDPSKMQEFILDKNNTNYLIEHGVLKKSAPEQAPKASEENKTTPPPSGDKNDSAS
jgi:hypothetical protein